MDIALAVSLIIAGIALFTCSMVLAHTKVERDQYREAWEHSLTPQHRDERVLFEWENRDLISKWEKLYPHVQNMPPARKYGEWATFCANYPTRDELENQIGRALPV